MEVVEEGDGFLKLSWDVPDDGGSPIVKYVVRYGDGRSDEISPADNYMISDLDNGKTYKIGVRARNAVGLGEWSDLVEGTPFAISCYRTRSGGGVWRLWRKVMGF